MHIYIYVVFIYLLMYLCIYVYLYLRTSTQMLDILCTLIACSGKMHGRQLSPNFSKSLCSGFQAYYTSKYRILYTGASS